MTNAELLAKIKAEIERRLKYTHDWLCGDEKRHSNQTFVSKNYYKMKGDERTLDALLSFLSTLEESEKPMNQDGFEKEFSRFIKKEKEEEPDGSLPSYGDYGIYRIARHFAKWGAENLKK